MQTSVLNNRRSPFCPGCGHNLATKNMGNALDMMGLNPLNVTVVSDIGCCGLVDGLLSCHTIHGLHGRAVALAMGIRMGLNEAGQKVIAVQGDGGATIGLQHLLEASRQNIDMTVIIQNNMVYGMTGGQFSGLSPTDLKETRIPDTAAAPSYDLCDLAHRAGAAYSTRTFVGADSADLWVEALGTPGFSLVEVVEICPSYGVKKVNALHEVADYEEVTLKNDRAAAVVPRREAPALFESLTGIERACEARLDNRLEVIIAGSAGEAIQSAGELLACAGVVAGLSATKKGEYPITIGTGFSIAEVILSREAIHYTGIEMPDVMIVTSRDGFERVKNRIGPHTRLIIDAQVDVPDHPGRITGDFRKTAGKKGAALAATATWLRDSGHLPVEALIEAAKGHKHADALISTIAPFAS